MKSFPIFLLLALPGGAFAADPGMPDAQSAMEHALTRAADTSWGPAPPMLPAGAQAAVLAGDPGKEGSFIIRLKMPPGYRVPRHWHPTDEAVTLVEGDLILSMGDAAATARDETLAPGDFINLPTPMRHEASSRGGAVVQVQAMGPFVITYLDPKDDPRNAGK
ncbi:cupin domain-containing protein [Luteimonas sp. 50]|uniref:Cupin domain-containing protein n=1 Tax=Cognatiluteimonas sedimenti TaxID=2927791 RepID=A0ABT0A781_9GAMM|nr:cupin domain-containing protein [Lysobacter sedimenti]MCJ0826829.1 cupin domain-containing protein [Lysobacter sedimenti]